MGDVTFTCRFDASSPLTIVWTKDGEMVSPQPATTGPTSAAPGLGAFTYTSVLSIDPVRFDDCGEYNCSVVDMKGLLTVTANLEVVGMFSLTLACTHI